MEIPGYLVAEKTMLIFSILSKNLDHTENIYGPVCPDAPPSRHCVTYSFHHDPLIVSILYYFWECCELDLAWTFVLSHCSLPKSWPSSGLPQESLFLMVRTKHTVRIHWQQALKFIEGFC